MIIYIDNSKDATRNLLELINEFGKVTGYKIHTQKSVALLYSNNEGSEREIKETITFTIASKRIKYLGINLPVETKDLYSKYDRYHIIQQSHSWAYIQRKPWFERIHAPQCSLQHCLQWPRHGNNLNVNRQRNG